MGCLCVSTTLISLYHLISLPASALICHVKLSVVGLKEYIIGETNTLSQL